MILLFRAFIDEVAHRGVKGLAELVAPQLGKAVDFFQGVLEKYNTRKGYQRDRDEAEKIARMTAAQVADDIREYAKQHIPDDRLREQTELYLSLAPGAMQRTLRGKHDPSGHSAPMDFVLDTPVKLADAFPSAVPTLRPGDPVPGRSASKYRLIAPVGSGGFGEVWRVEDLYESRDTALKVFPEAKRNLDAIRHELTQAKRLMDPKTRRWLSGVVPVVDDHLEGDTPWIMYEFVGGGTLADLIVEWQTLDVPERVRRALLALHSLAGTCSGMHSLCPALVHRDMKPANVLRDGDSLRITDLGLGGAAVAFEIDTEKSVGRRASVTGRLPSMLHGSYSLNYASPQQRGGSDPDPRDDIHALGVIGYQMLTGKLDAAPGTDVAEDLEELKIPADVIRMVKACAASDASRRPRDAGDLHQRLQTLIGEWRDVSPLVVPLIAVAETPPSVPERTELTQAELADERTVAEQMRLQEERERIAKYVREEHQEREENRQRLAKEEAEKRDKFDRLFLGCFLVVGVVVCVVLFVKSLSPPPGDGNKPEVGKPPELVAIKPGSRALEEMTIDLGKSGVKMTFCWCPPGTFERGSNDNDGRADEKPVREITISKGFWMAKTETTQAQWKALGFETKCCFRGDELPVESVTHTAAVAYADKLKQLTGQAVRLPTEAEWEYACRAGTKTKYHSGDTEADLATVAWYMANSESKTHPVGQKKANAWGIHDMHGNIWEWCSDWYNGSYYAESPATDAVGADNDSSRVKRGGSWSHLARTCRSATRSFELPNSINHFTKGFVGFRLVLVSSGQ